MKAKHLLSLILLSLILFFLFGCVLQRQVILEEPTAPRVIIKEIPTGQGDATEKEEYFEAPAVYFDPAKGYIENQAFPYVPKVWLLLDDGTSILLSGPAEGPPDFPNNSSKEYNNILSGILRIERWRYFPYHGGWRKSPRIELCRLEIEEFSQRGHRRRLIAHYGWRAIVYSDRTIVQVGYID